MQGVRARFEQRWAVPGNVSNSQHVQKQIVMFSLKSKCGGKYDCCVPCRLIDVEVDGDHEVQRWQDPFEACPVWHTEDWISCESDHASNLSRSRCLDFFSQDGD